MKFFEPSGDFLDWLAKYAAGRCVYDVGCGEGHITIALQARSVKCLGIDMFRQDDYIEKGLFNKIIVMDAERCSFLKEREGLIIFCRPCHSGFVERIIQTCHPQSEVLYISKPENLEVDLPNCKYLKLDVETGAKEGEQVYRVGRPSIKKWLKK